MKSIVRKDLHQSSWLVLYNISCIFCIIDWRHRVSLCMLCIQCSWLACILSKWCIFRNDLNLSIYLNLSICICLIFLFFALLGRNCILLHLLVPSKLVILYHLFLSMFSKSREYLYPIYYPSLWACILST